MRIWKLMSSCLLIATLAGCQSGTTSSWFSGKMNPFSTASKTPPANGYASQMPVTSSPNNNVLPSMVSRVEDPTSLSGKTPKFGPEVYVKAGEMQGASGNLEGATQQFQKALELSPNNFSALLNLGRVNDQQNKFDDAVKYYQRAAQADPKSAVALNSLGLCYARQQKFGDSAIQLQKAIQLEPQKKKYRNNLAWVLVESGRYDEAMSQLTAAHGEALAHYNLAYLVQQKGQTGLAVDHLHRALEINPQFDEAEILLSKLSVPKNNFVNYSNPAREGAQSDTTVSGNSPPTMQPQQGAFGGGPGYGNANVGNSNVGLPSVPPNFGTNSPPYGNAGNGSHETPPPMNGSFPPSNSFVPPSDNNAEKSTPLPPPGGP